MPATLIVSVFIFQFLFFAPLHVLMQNFGEFSVRFADVLVIYLVVSIGLTLFLGLIVRLFKAPALLAALTFLSSVAFFESRFALAFAQHHPFDGTPLDWHALQWLSHIELGVILTLAIFFAAIHKRTRLLSTISVFIFVFLTAGFCYQLASHSRTLLSVRAPYKTDSLYLDQFYRLSNKRNIIHIVPDQAQGAMLHDILASDYKRYSEIFDGFTLFTQASGRYKGTYPSVVFYMAGEAPDPENDLVRNQLFTWKYIEETLQQRSIATTLARNGFRTFGFQFHPGIFCKGSFTACTGTHEEVFGGVAVNSPQRRVLMGVLTVMDLALFQMSPIVLRERVYDNGHWFVRRLARGAATHSGILDIFVEKMRVEENPGTYNYIHHAGAHAPLLFDHNCNYVGTQPINWDNQREQVTCTLVQLETMIQALKKNDVYDRTMIVINGDHGTPSLPPSLPTQSGNGISRKLMGKASTLMLIKPPDVRGPLHFSDKPVTIGDIPATIVDTFGLEMVYPGIQVFSDNPAVERERQYFSYESSSKVHILQALPNMTRYRIRGNIFDGRDWVLPNATSAGEYQQPSQLRVDHVEFLNFTRGFSLLEDHDTPVRWIDGKQAVVSLYFPAGRPVALVFKSYVPPFIIGQWMEVWVGDKLITKLSDQDLLEERHTIPLPDEWNPAEKVEVEFKMGVAVSTGKDPRNLSVLFSYIGLEPTD